MSYLTQMLGLNVQNFVSAATGVAVVIALARGLAQKSAATIGNFWADLVRGVLYVLLPLCVVLALVLVSQGVVQNFNAYTEATTLSGESQIIPQGPDCHQAIRDKRRRILQYQQRASLRESDTVEQLLADAFDSAHPDSADLHVWRNGWE